jgi:hypothetical protein
MIQERHHVGGEVGDAVLEPPIPLASKVIAWKWREKAGTCLNHPQRPKPRPPIRIRGDPSPWTSKSMLVFSVKVNGIR